MSLQEEKGVFLESNSLYSLALERAQKKERLFFLSVKAREEKENVMAKYMGYNSEGKMGGRRKEFSIFFSFRLCLSLRAGRMRCLTRKVDTKNAESFFFVVAERILFSRS